MLNINFYLFIIINHVKINHIVNKFLTISDEMLELNMLCGILIACEQVFIMHISVASSQH